MRRPTGRWGSSASFFPPRRRRGLHRNRVGRSGECQEDQKVDEQKAAGISLKWDEVRLSSKFDKAMLFAEGSSIRLGVALSAGDLRGGRKGRPMPVSVNNAGGAIARAVGCLSGANSNIRR